MAPHSKQSPSGSPWLTIEISFRRSRIHAPWIHCLRYLSQCPWSKSTCHGSGVSENLFGSSNNQSRTNEFWSLSKNSECVKPASHIYVFVNLRGNQPPIRWLQPNPPPHIDEEEAKSGTWYSFDCSSALSSSKGWRSSRIPRLNQTCSRLQRRHSTH